jgi:8-oxo-dGTP pyrophosphatase MutT (NUDIX family)/phosphohistidine phosphatase SixA
VALTPSVRAAGAVLRRVGPEGMEVLLVHRPRYDDWTLPKGKAQEGESDLETAIREVEEETGFRGTLGGELPSSSYRDSRGRRKLVRYWTMRPESGEFEPGSEVNDARWVPEQSAAEVLSYDRDREVLRGMPAPLLVNRHASAGDREDWDGDDEHRPLDDRGRRQAEALVRQLAPFQLVRVVSSPFDRCVQSVEPLARARGLEVELANELAEGAGPERMAGLLDELAGQAVVLCAHGPELEPLFGKVKKGGTVVVEPADGRFLELGRLPPPE